MLDNTPGQSPTPLRLPFRNVHSGPNEDAGPAGQFRLQNCTRTRLVLESRCGRIEYLFQTTKIQGKIKVHRKLYLSLPRIGILGVPSPNCMLRLQFWDGALLPPAVLGWHLLTCNILPPDVRWHLLTCNILPPALRWHLLTLKMVFTGRFAIAPSHLEKSFYWQSCDGIFSP